MKHCNKSKTWKPVILDEIFAVNEFDANKMIEHNIYGEIIITYNDVFKYPHRVKEYLLESPVPRFMHLSNGKNFNEFGFGVILV